MSPVLIAGLVIAGLFLLIAIGYINQIVEKNNLEKARLRADLTDRIRRCAVISDAFPGQMMTPALKLLLTRLELYLYERLQPLDRANPQLATRIAALRSAAEKGEEITVSNAPVQIISEARAKEVRLQLEDLHAQIVWAAKQGQLDPAGAQRWVRDIQRMLVMLHVEYFNNLGKLSLQHGNPHKARLAFERGIQHIRKQPDPAEYQQHLKQLKASYTHANQLEQTQQKPILDQPSELAEGLKNLEDEDDWKINNIY